MKKIHMLLMMLVLPLIFSAAPTFAFECPKHFKEAQAAIDQATAAMKQLPMDQHGLVHTLIDDAKMLLSSGKHNHEKPAAGAYDHARAIAKAGSARGYARAAQMLAERTKSAQMEMKKDMKMEMTMAKEGIFEGKGEVIAVVPAKGQIVLEHDEIKGFMMAMTMGYPVESKVLMKGLSPGDSIKFKIDAAKKKIVAIERLEKQ